LRKHRKFRKHRNFRKFRKHRKFRKFRKPRKFRKNQKIQLQIEHRENSEKLEIQINKQKRKQLRNQIVSSNGIFQRNLKCRKTKKIPLEELS
jgi:hypothetical protein